MDSNVSFGLQNLCVLIVYLACMVGIGLAFAGKQKTAKDFFLAGRNMPWWAVAMSVFASITTGISYLGTPGLVYQENVLFFVGILMMPVAAPVIILLFLPFYHKLKVTTSYEYIFLRFGAPARYCVSGLFICARIGWLGTVIYAPAVAITVVTGSPLWVAILAMGLLGTAYTVLGGVTAVIWSDVAQFLILFGTAVVVSIALIVSVPGGFMGIMEVARDSGKLNLTEWWPSLTHMTVIAVAVAYFFQFMHDYGVDQLTVQRLLATKDLPGMVRATFANSLISVVVIGLLTFIGLGLYAYHGAFPERLPDGIAADQIFPFYVMHAMPRGISGLVSGGLFAAAMSCMDSGISSLSTVVVNDFVRPLRSVPLSDTREVQLARVLTFVFGAFATGVAFFASTIGEIMKVSQTFLGLFSGPVLALFLLGMLTRRASFAGWFVGVCIAIPATIWVQRATDVHFIYYFPISLVTALVVGFLVSVVVPQKQVASTLTVWSREG
ncbi:MAG: sodium/solute symporter [Candidatus Hydrogenedentales bacterium]|jgi:SSS family transporter